MLVMALLMPNVAHPRVHAGVFVQRLLHAVVYGSPRQDAWQLVLPFDVGFYGFMIGCAGVCQYVYIICCTYIYICIYI